MKSTSAEHGGDEERGDQHDLGGGDGLVPAGPGHLLQLREAFLKEQDDSSSFPPSLGLFPSRVQARQDSNPQHPVLETGALPLELLAYGD